MVVFIFFREINYQLNIYLFLQDEDDENEDAGEDDNEVVVIGGDNAGQESPTKKMKRKGKNKPCLKKYDQFTQNTTCFWGSIPHQI